MIKLNHNEVKLSSLDALLLEVINRMANEEYIELIVPRSENSLLSSRHEREGASYKKVVMASD